MTQEAKRPFQLLWEESKEAYALEMEELKERLSETDKITSERWDNERRHLPQPPQSLPPPICLVLHLS